MRKIHRIISLIIAIAVAVFANAANAYAVDAPKLKLIGASGEVGEIVSVDLVIENNPGITAFSINLAYPSESLELIEIEPSESFSFGFSSGKQNANPIRISWYDSYSEDVYTNGKIAAYRFRILNLEEPAYLSISYNPNNVFNSSFENQHFEIENAYVSHSHIHNYSVTAFENGVATLECADCADTKSDVFEEHINERNYAPLDVVKDGIINAKDFAYFLKNY